MRAVSPCTSLYVLPGQFAQSCGLPSCTSCLLSQPPPQNRSSNLLIQRPYMHLFKLTMHDVKAGSAVLYTHPTIYMGIHINTPWMHNALPKCDMGLQKNHILHLATCSTPEQLPKTAGSALKPAHPEWHRKQTASSQFITIRYTASRVANALMGSDVEKHVAQHCGRGCRKTIQMRPQQ